MRTRSKRPHSTQMTFDGACTLIEAALQGTARQEILSEASKWKDFRGSLVRLRESMTANVWKAGGRHIRLDRLVTTYESRTRRDGLHVLHDWDGKADAVNKNTIPVDVLDFLLDKRGTEPSDPTALAILLDYYFLYVLVLLSLRVWDEGQADDNLDRLDRLLRELQGPNGSGQPFAHNAETLLLLAGSHYELETRGYDQLLERVRTLSQRHRANIAIGHAASLGSHLRFGFEATYSRDTAAMRDDNSADYPWLCFSLATLMKEYSRLHEAGCQGTERETLVEAILNGLSPDAGAFAGQNPPACLAACENDRAEFRELVHRYKQDYLDDCERHRPSDRTYSPMSFFFNFSHNVLKGTVVDALLWGGAWNLALNDLLTGMPRGEAKAQSKQKLANTLMEYARSSPDRIRGRLMPVIVYDPLAGRRAFAATVRTIKEEM